MNKNLKYQTAAITGGLGDIGKAICLAFARNGTSIALCDIRPSEEAAAFLSLLGDSCGVECTYHQVDVADPNQVKSWLGVVSGQLGIPNVVVANAARVTLAPALEITPEQWNQEINVNLNGAFYMIQEAARLMVNGGIPGHMVLIGSWAAHQVHLDMPAYSVAKAALRMLCKCMALELAPKGILVNEVAPGYVQAGLSGKIWKERPDLCEQAAARVPTGNFISPEAVAEEVLHLCRPENRNITGSTLLMDGGLSLS
ncbi:diacetyl reductase [Parapedobacter defluvii]|uniref:Diacetyl reductase n=1 Tax=Parapedobacter defluvii TaxID=2045106 RepID=A0ABQ1KYA5_9SPHI|nr:SDR family oxidoreductase [Parapedobacter defluvii]GGC12416.1 diacetyl reductase [Parapedobacter defluvii]